MKTIVERDRRAAKDKSQAVTLTTTDQVGRADHLQVRQIQRLHRAIGNQAVQRVLAQRQSAQQTIQRDGETDTEQPDDGTVTIQPVQDDPYDVTGTSLAEVMDQLDPTEWGHCRYHYDYDYETTNGRTTRVDVTLTLTVRLPRWQGQGWDDASEAVKGEWRRMLRALATHEEGHADIARDWAPTVRERLLNRPEGNVQQRYSQVLGEVRTDQDRYDDQTNHGQTQGVSLDLSIE
jgi:hypothetical protein